VTAGLTAKAPWGSFGSVRVRHIGARPATADGSLTAEGFTVIDAQAGHRVGPIEARLDVQNLLNAAWREVQFATTSKLRSDPAPVTEIHYTPGWPLTVRATLAAYF
jgi:hypothetical protein